jgi:hypothetical protein
MNIESTDHNQRLTTARRHWAGLFLAMPLMSVSCSPAPEYSIFGSFFPVWIFCSVGGLLLTTGAHALIARTAIAEHLGAPALLYLSMAIFFACMLWLLFYR